ncbi:MAG TPA: hypothetical protein PK911_05345 [Candidatus Saccharibacteria bacterium]|nr:hypothetical protein [Candidatus Saccharibacteria bacterium]
MRSSEKALVLPPMHGKLQRSLEARPLYSAKHSKQERKSLLRDLKSLEQQIKEEWRSEVLKPGTFLSFQGYPPLIPFDLAAEEGIDPLDSMWLGSIPISQAYRFRKVLEKYGIQTEPNQLLSHARIGPFDAYVRKSWPKNARGIYAFFIACGPLLSPELQDLVLEWAGNNVAMHEITSNIETGYKELECLAYSGPMKNPDGSLVGDYYEEVDDWIPINYSDETDWIFEPKVDTHLYSIQHTDTYFFSKPLRDAIWQSSPETEFIESATKR